jgi:hypothetical protein
MKIEPFDRNSYHVTTEKGVVYLVDLEAYSFNAYCSCKSFEYSCQPYLEADMNDFGEIRTIRRCKHLKELIGNRGLIKSQEDEPIKRKEVEETNGDNANDETSRAWNATANRFSTSLKPTFLP